MTIIDYVVLVVTLLAIALYGTWKNSKSKNIDGYFLGDNQLKWGSIGLSVMATQASAITFLSTPGLAYESGMAFVQNYLGLPLALIVVSVVFIPIFYKLKVFTAYEYLENRFNLRTRVLAAGIFLIQRGLAAGITIYAPAIVLASVLSWDLTYTVLFVGIVVIIYTVSGGSKAVSMTQKWQMAVILLGMSIAFASILSQIPDNVSFWHGMKLAGKLGKTEAINFNFDFEERYTFWSGITGGFFLALAYFGTDQSQVQRYLGAKSIAESRLGLMFNAALKVPMQFLILLTGVLVFVFYQFQNHDILFDQQALTKVEKSASSDDLSALRGNFTANHSEKGEVALSLIDAMKSGDEVNEEKLTERYRDLHQREIALQGEAKELVAKADPDYSQKDSDFVFIRYVLDFLPKGIVGLLIAVILAAAMSSTAGELNALGSTSAVDFYKRMIKPGASDAHYVAASKWLTALWGLVALSFALYANMVENLIEAVNILGSVFYGPVLGVFLCAFFLKFVRGNSVFIGALVGQTIVILCFLLLRDAFSYLYYNVIGCISVMVLASIHALGKPGQKKGQS